MDEYVVCVDCRDACIRSIFKTKRAIYYGKQGEKARRKFWGLARELHPNLKGTLAYDSESKLINASKE